MPASAPDDAAPIEAWLREALAAKWNQTLREEVPDELLALAEQFPDEP